MTKQTKSLGGLADIQASPPPTPETTEERIDRLERRILQAETLLNDVMQQLDRPYRDQPLFDGKTHSNGKPRQAKPPAPKPKKAQPKKIAPSEIIKALLKHKPQSRSEMEAETGLDTEAVKKCVTWMSKKDFIEKTTEKDNDGNSRWQRKP